MGRAAFRLEWQHFNIVKQQRAEEAAAQAAADRLERQRMWERHLRGPGF